MTTTWTNKLTEIKQDEHQLKVALAMYLIVKGHLTVCTHKRQCAEQLISIEAEHIAEFSDTEERIAAEKAVGF